MIEKFKSNQFLVGGISTSVLSGLFIWAMSQLISIDPLVTVVELNTKALYKLNETNVKQHSMMMSLIAEEKVEISEIKIMSKVNQYDIRQLESGHHQTN